MASCGKTVTSALLKALEIEDHCCNDALVSMSCGLADGPREDAARAIAALMSAEEAGGNYVGDGCSFVVFNCLQVMCCCLATVPDRHTVPHYHVILIFLFNTDAPSCWLRSLTYIFDHNSTRHAYSVLFPGRLAADIFCPLGSSVLLSGSGFQSISACTLHFFCVCRFDDSLVRSNSSQSLMIHPFRSW